MAAGRARRILFRIFYSTSFTIIFFLLIAFICVSPADILYQSYHRNRLIDLFLTAGAYVLTGVIAAFLYASRLYTNRSTLRDIPKNFIPIDKDDLPRKNLWRLIEDCKSRSAVIAYEAKPRSWRIENELPEARSRIDALLRPEHSKEHPHFEPQWGPIAHVGWSSPAASDIANLDYNTVVAELIDLIEAKAVSLAPIDPLSTPGQDGMAIPDADIIEKLTRTQEMGMRNYVMQLIGLGVLSQNSLSAGFLTLYERARFAAQPLSDSEFQSLMRMFAEILRTMQPVDVDVLDLDGEDRADSSLRQRTQQPASSAASTFSVNSGGSVRHTGPRRMSDDSVPSRTTDEESDWHESGPLVTAPAPRIDNGSRSLSRRLASDRSNATSRHRPQLRQRLSQRSLASTRSSRSQRSNAGSVIRLNDSANENALPYTITIPDRGRSRME